MTHMILVAILAGAGVLILCRMVQRQRDAKGASYQGSYPQFSDSAMTPDHPESQNYSILSEKTRNPFAGQYGGSDWDITRDVFGC